MNKMSV